MSTGVRLLGLQWWSPIADVRPAAFSGLAADGSACQIILPPMRGHRDCLKHTRVPPGRTVAD